MSDCIFCKIINKEIPSDIVYEDDKIMVFKDIEPQAPVHLIMIPKEHIASLNDIDESNCDIMAYLMKKIKDVASLMNLKNGYRIVSNCGEDGLQTVPHIHIHLIGGRKMHWPPG